MTARLPQVIAERGELLERAGIEAGRVEAEMILCHVLGVDRLTLYLHGQNMLTSQLLTQVDDIVERRQSRYPLQYIFGHTWFYGRRFEVTPAVMVPTPETELLCEQALRILRLRSLDRPRILDVGTGSGVIAATMACESPEAQVVAVDLSNEALLVARKNALDLGVSERVEFRLSDLFSALEETESFDLILSNPPYICETVYDGLPPEVQADPKLAITSGNDGLDAIRVIVREAPRYLNPGGHIIFEIGYDQALRVAALTENDKRYASLDILRDFNDIDRIVMFSCAG